jgi:succinate-acetate transporter protein
MSEDTAVKKANPGPLGLIGFGLTCMLLCIHYLGVIELSIVIISMGFLPCGLAMIITGIIAFRQGNTFDGTVFAAYGLFWWSFVVILINPIESLTTASNISLGLFDLFWGIFTLFMFIVSLKQTRVAQVLFFTLTLLFFGLAIYGFTGSEPILLVAAWIGIVCAASAIYEAVAIVTNDVFEKTVFPLG